MRGACLFQNDEFPEISRTAFSKIFWSFQKYNFLNKSKIIGTFKSQVGKNTVGSFEEIQWSSAKNFPKKRSNSSPLKKRSERKLKFMGRKKSVTKISKAGQLERLLPSQNEPRRDQAAPWKCSRQTWRPPASSASKHDLNIFLMILSIGTWSNPFTFFCLSFSRISKKTT